MNTDPHVPPSESAGPKLRRTLPEIQDWIFARLQPAMDMLISPPLLLQRVCSENLSEAVVPFGLVGQSIFGNMEREFGGFRDQRAQSVTGTFP
jgi:hypothetical protein